MMKIEYFYKDEPLGSAEIKWGSSHTDRWSLAVLKGKTPFDKFILDGGRLVGWKVSKEEFDPKSGYETITGGETEYWNYK